jgi:hypothetical protein
VLLFQIRVDEFTSIRESRHCFAKAFQRFATHDAIAGGKTHVYKMLKEGVLLWQRFLFTHNVTHSEDAAKAD